MTKLINAVPVLAAVDFPAAVEFWREVLGFEGTVHGNFATLSRDGVDLFLGEVEEQLIPDNTMAWIRTDDVPGMHTDWSTRIAESRFADRIRLADPQQRPWGTEFAIVDPAGNCVHVAEAA